MYAICMPFVGKIEEDGKRENIGNALKSTFLDVRESTECIYIRFAIWRSRVRSPSSPLAGKPLKSRFSGFCFAFDLHEKCGKNSACMSFVCHEAFWHTKAGLFSLI